ncbi:MAG: cell division protein FtsZ [Alphaproteobacteria bacterium]|nr:cell division protein FtsZ [Alphaproteobacteria bacterium]
MSINLAVPETQIVHLKPRIAVIGVGGGGGNAVNNMISKNLEGVDFIVANTDSQALANSKASRKIQLGLKITQGLGAGARPEIGKLAAEEAQSEIEKELEGLNMVFITAGMGGGTGSGAAPVVAKTAKEKGILTVGVVTKPFAFEGKKRMGIAEDALAKFTQEVDSLIIIPNQNLFRVADKNTTFADAFIMVDNVLYSGVRSITDLMMMPGLINLDFADIKSIMEDKGKAIMGTGEAEGENRARVAAEQALSNPLLDDCSMKGAKGVLINVTGGDDMTLLEVDEAANIIKDEVDEDANIIFGSSFDSDLKGKIRVSIVVTGIENKPGSRFKEKALGSAAYIDESFSNETKAENNFAITKEEIDDNLERFKANPENEVSQSDEYEAIETEQPVTEQIEETELKEAEISTTAEDTENESQTNVTPDFSRFDDFENLERSTAIPEAPQASALFNAIINKTPTPESVESFEKSISDFLPDDKDIFTSKTQINDFESEPVLFPEQSEPHFIDRNDEPKEDEASYQAPSKTKFIDKILGISRARKNRKDTPNIDERFAQVSAPSLSSGSESVDFSSTDNNFDNLDIPSFLRRK